MTFTISRMIFAFCLFSIVVWNEGGEKISACPSIDLGSALLM
jgi:hypothetical protein